MSNKLTTSQITEAAEQAGYDPTVVRALLQVETGGSGYDRKTGYLLIQFEPRWFKKLLGAKARREINTAYATPVSQRMGKQADLLSDWFLTQNNKVEGQVAERVAFNAAKRIDEHAALLATSWGLPQMMGFNHKLCEYNTVEEMVESFRQSEANQLAAMLRFIKSKEDLHQAVLDHDWRTIAYFYNGSQYAVHNYHGKLAAAFTALTLTPSPA